MVHDLQTSVPHIHTRGCAETASGGPARGAQFPIPATQGNAVLQTDQQMSPLICEGLYMYGIKK